MMRNIINGKHELKKDSWVLSYVRRKEGSHVFLILEGLDENDDPVIKQAELGYKEVGKKHDCTRAQIYYYDVTGDKLKLMQKEQEDYLCKTFEITLEEKNRLEEKIRKDQDEDLFYNLAGSTKLSGFWGASLTSSGSVESKESSIHSLEKSAKVGGSLAISSMATLRKGHNCVSWPQEAMQYMNPEYDLRTNFGTYVVAAPQVELTRCAIL